MDRSTAEHNAVTVNNVTVIITEFQPKQKSSSTSNGAGSSGVNGNTEHGTPSADNNVEMTDKTKPDT